MVKKHKDEGVPARILALLKAHYGTWYAVHEIAEALFIGQDVLASCNSVATRCHELTGTDGVLSRFREGKPYKEYALTKPVQLTLL